MPFCDAGIPIARRFVELSDASAKDAGAAFTAKDHKQFEAAIKALGVHTEKCDACHEMVGRAVVEGLRVGLPTPEHPTPLG